MKKHVKIIIYVIVLILLVPMIDLIICLNRGYGFLGTTYRMERLYQKSYQNMRPIVNYISDYYSNTPDVKTWPKAELISQDIENIQLCDKQPYKNMNVWIIKNTPKKDKFLYTPISISENPELLNDPNYLATVIICDYAEREQPEGSYHPYDGVPEFVIKKQQPEYWACWTSLGAFLNYTSDSPPIPGAILITSSGRLENSDISCYYPEKLVPTVKAIYPNLEITNDKIFKPQNITIPTKMENN